MVIADADALADTVHDDGDDDDGDQRSDLPQLAGHLGMLSPRHRLLARLESTR